jgi:hypothetical protein
LHLPHALNFCYDVFSFYSRIGFFLDHISVLLLLLLLLSLLLLYKSLRSVHHHYFPDLGVAGLRNPALDPTLLNRNTPPFHHISVGTISSQHRRAPRYEGTDRD